MAKVYVRTNGPVFCSASPLSIISINCLVKTFSQATWVLMRRPFIYFAMTDYEISKYIFSSTHIKKNKIMKNLILILLCIKEMCWTVKFKLSILVDWKAPILAYKVLLSIGIIEVIVAITRNNSIMIVSMKLKMVLKLAMKVLYVEIKLWINTLYKTLFLMRKNKES